MGPGEEHPLYQFSRSIYRQLAPYVTGGDGCLGTHKRRELLRLTESAMERLGTDPSYFARPTRSIFREVRSLFPMSEQSRVYAVVEGHVALALKYVEDQARVGATFDGSPRRCNSMTRKGTACVRTPLPGSDYCPSHQHLEETVGRATAA